MTALAVDIGGTKVALALVSRDGAIAHKYQEPTDLAGPAAVAQQIAAYAESLPVRPALVSVSLPAVLERSTDRVIWAPNLPGWRDLPFREMLQERLGLPAFLEYDGHAAVLGEWWCGAARGYRSAASIIIGTGIGGGLVVDGRLSPGRDRLAGAAGWFPMVGPGGLDHWENLAAGPAIARRAEALIATGAATSLPPGPLTAKAVFDAAREGDGLALQVLQEAAQLIGQGVAVIVSYANPEIVVLGGSIGQQGDLLLDAVRATVARWAQPYGGRDLPIVSSTLGEEAGLLGAAYSAFMRLSTG